MPTGQSKAMWQWMQCNVCGANWWPNLQLMQMAPMVLSLWLELCFQPYWKINQVLDSIAWVRCASGNVLLLKDLKVFKADGSHFITLQKTKLGLVQNFLFTIRLFICPPITPIRRSGKTTQHFWLDFSLPEEKSNRLNCKSDFQICSKQFLKHCQSADLSNSNVDSTLLKGIWSTQTNLHIRKLCNSCVKDFTVLGLLLLTHCGAERFSVFSEAFDKSEQATALCTVEEKGKEMNSWLFAKLWQYLSLSHCGGNTRNTFPGFGQVSHDVRPQKVKVTILNCSTHRSSLPHKYSEPSESPQSHPETVDQFLQPLSDQNWPKTGPPDHQRLECWRMWGMGGGSGTTEGDMGEGGEGGGGLQQCWPLQPHLISPSPHIFKPPGQSLFRICYLPQIQPAEKLESSTHRPQKQSANYTCHKD